MLDPSSANITRSPGASALNRAGMYDPTCACCRDVRGSFTPCFAKTYCTNPEQSNPVFGDVPPQRYGVPMYRSAVGITRRALDPLLAVLESTVAAVAATVDSLALDVLAIR